MLFKNTLGDVFSGIALTLGRPYTIGDWVLLGDGTEGRVVASNWRSTYLLTAAHNQMVLPNSVLAKQALTNVSKPDENHQLMLPLRVAPTRRPQFVVDVMREVLASCNAIVHDLPPAVILARIGAAAIEVELYFQVTGPPQPGIARNEVIDLVFRYCAANDLTLAMPADSTVLSRRPIAEMPRASFLTLIGFNGLFRELAVEEREALAAIAVERQFAAGEVLVDQGGLATGLMIIQTGTVALMEDGQQAVRLAPGDCFGALGVLFDRAERREVRAVTSAVVYEMGKIAFDTLMAERPELAKSLTSYLVRMEAAQTSHLDAPALKGGARGDLVHAIRAMFHNV